VFDSELWMQGFVRSTKKYWVREDVASKVRFTILQHLPVFRFDDSISADYQLVNSVYLDNCNCELYHGRLDKRPGAQAIRLRWYGTGIPKTVFVERKTHHEDWTGESSTKERFRLPEEKVLPYLRGDYTWEQVCNLASTIISQYLLHEPFGSVCESTGGAQAIISR
jgi:SPX domain protein involved in polyphosphate accumulation